MPILSELKKALSTTGDGVALLPYDLEPFLTEELLKLQPLTQLLDVEQANGKTHEFTVRSSHPNGWFEGEATPANNKNSAYQRKSVQMKIQRIWGSVTGFAQAMDEAFVDAFAAELEGSLEGMANVMEYGVLWGASNDLAGLTGDAYQFSGIIPMLAKNAPNNFISAGGAKVSLDYLDQAIAAVSKYRGVGADPKMWFMGVRMKQVVDGLQTRVQIPLTSVELADGKISMGAYSGAPIYETDFVVPEDATTSPTVTATKAAGGALADATYTYKIASITLYGEQVAGTASAGITTETTNNSVDLTWTADANAKSYMIFRKTGAGEYGLLDVIPALTYDGNGTVNGVVETYSDEGAKTPIAKVIPLATGEQNIVLVNRNPRRGIALLGKIDDMGRPLDRLVSFIELARTKDSYDFFLKNYSSLKMVHPNVAAAVIRNVKVA